MEAGGDELTPYHQEPFVSLYRGDCLTVMRAMEADRFDAIITDPPYGLTQNKKGGSGEKSLNLNSPAGRSRITTGGFMGMKWDHGVPSAEYWAEALRVAKPGAHLLAFGGTRTYHRLACMIEDAGWEIRDCIMWVYGSGFPKSHNLDGQWDGWGTALKPAWEPILVARKPLIGTVAENVQALGVGALNIDGCRIETSDVLQGSTVPHDMRGGGLLNRRPSEGDILGYTRSALGRWPANLIHDGSEEVVACFPDAPGQMAEVSTNREPRKAQNVYGSMVAGNGRIGEPSADSENEGPVGFNMRPGMRRLDAGSAARFFYCAKASRSDRNEGCEEMPSKPLNWSNGTQSPGSFQGEGTDKTSPNNHPTVKPTDLMRYLCRLVTPPDGTILDPFMGSGSTGKAARLEGFWFVGIEQEQSYCDIAIKRISSKTPTLF